MYPSQNLTRRSLLAGTASLSMSALCQKALGPATAAPQPPAPIIDVHHHYLPPFYTERIMPWLVSTKASSSDPIVRWTAQKDTAELDKANISTAILSISSPGVDSPGFDFGPEKEMAPLARRCNEFAAELSKTSKGRYLFFTALPMPNIDASLKEVAYGYDNLGATGVGLMTNYRGLYLGDKSFTPLFEELNRRKAVVFIHPTDAPCCRDLIPDVPTPSTEYAVDTGRTITSLLWSGTLSKYSNIRFIFSHGGGMLPTIHSRITRGIEKFRPELMSRVPEGPIAALAKIYVDTATVANNPAFAALQAWAKPNQILYGSDYPWSTPLFGVEGLTSLGIPRDTLKMIYHDNTAALIGRA